MQIAGFDTEDLADGSGKAGITWISEKVLNKKDDTDTMIRFNPTSVTNDNGTYQEGTGTIGGWEKSNLRSYLKNTIKPLIPADVQSAIKTISNSQVAYNTNGKQFTQTTQDDVWTIDKEDTDAYPAVLGTPKLRKRGQGRFCIWLRSAYTDNSVNVINVSGEYLWQNELAYGPRCTLLCFCT